jgi:transposase
MPAKETSMRKIKTVLRLHHEVKLSQHQIAKSLGLSVGVVNKYLTRAKLKNIAWPLPAEYEDDDLLEKHLRSPNSQTFTARHEINFTQIQIELRKKGVTLQLLYEEYKDKTKQPFSYTHFCLLYRDFKSRQPRSMRQAHKAGDKVFVDYAGPTVEVIDPDTGEIRKAQIFIGALGASNFTYVEATWTQKTFDWINSHRRMFEYFGGVPALVVPDNLKAGVTKACRYEPDINPTYADFIEYYKTAVLPARPYKPKDKSKVENAVLVTERWILARLRNSTFVGLNELNKAIRELLEFLNNRPFKKLPGCRRILFEEIDKPALRPLPQYPYEFAEFKKARVHIDYHIELDGHYYSVHHSFIKKEIECRYTSMRVECWYKGKKIATHIRSYKKGGYTTLPEHMPKAHLRHSEWSVARFISWSSQMGDFTTHLVKHLLENRPHPEQGYRSCLGLLSLSKKYGNARLEKACCRAWRVGTKTRTSVKSILVHKLEESPLPNDLLSTSDAPSNHLPDTHENLRGANYYKK